GWRQMSSAGVPPRAMSDGSLVHDAEHGRLYAYGGYAYSSSQYDFVRYDLFQREDREDGSWQPFHMSGEARSLGAGSAVVLDTRRRRALAWSGSEYSDRLLTFTIRQDN